MTSSGISIRHGLDDLAAVRSLLEQMIREGQAGDAIDMIVALLADLRDQNDALQVRLKTALRKLYGRSSEKLSKEQLDLFERILGSPEAPAPAAAATPDPAAKSGEPDAAPPATPAPPPPKGKPHGRSGMPEGLPRRTTRRQVEKICVRCGRGFECFDTESHWQIEFHPGQFVVEETLCEKSSCPHCRDEVVTAPAPGKVIPGGEPGPGLLARVVVDKAEDHLPLDRQHRRLAREGLVVPKTTLEGWWTQGLDLLTGLHDPLLDEAIRAWLPQIDATGLDVLDRDHPKGIRMGHLWTVVGGRSVVFNYAAGKSDGLGDLLALRCAPGQTSGAPIQCDGENLFSTQQTRRGISIVLVNCHMHARRYFDKAQKTGDLRAARPLQIWSRIYEIERRATADKVGPEERARRRQEETWPLLEQLREWVLQIAPAVPPTSPLGKAIRYLERRWMSLVVFVTDGRIPLDTGEVERQIRRIAIGRGNWAFSGSDAGAGRLALAASLCATCRRLGLDPWAYLRDVFAAIADGISAQRLVSEFTPWAWAEKQAQQSDAQQFPTATT